MLIASVWRQRQFPPQLGPGHCFLACDAPCTSSMLLMLLVRPHPPLPPLPSAGSKVAFFSPALNCSLVASQGPICWYSPHFQSQDPRGLFHCPKPLSRSVLALAWWHCCDPVCWCTGRLWPAVSWGIAFCYSGVTLGFCLGRILCQRLLLCPSCLATALSINGYSRTAGCQSWKGRDTGLQKGKLLEALGGTEVFGDRARAKIEDS